MVEEGMSGGESRCYEVVVAEAIATMMAVEAMMVKIVHWRISERKNYRA